MASWSSVVLWNPHLSFRLLLIEYLYLHYLVFCSCVYDSVVWSSRNEVGISLLDLFFVFLFHVFNFKETKWCELILIVFKLSRSWFSLCNKSVMSPGKGRPYHQSVPPLFFWQLLFFLVTQLIFSSIQGDKEHPCLNSEGHGFWGAQQL